MSLRSFTPSVAGDDMALAAAERRGHIPARSSRRMVFLCLFTLNVVGRSLPGWLTGDIWIVLVGRVG